MSLEMSSNLKTDSVASRLNRCRFSIATMSDVSWIFDEKGLGHAPELLSLIILARDSRLKHRSRLRAIHFARTYVFVCGCVWVCVCVYTRACVCVCAPGRVGRNFYFFIVDKRCDNKRVWLILVRGNGFLRRRAPGCSVECDILLLTRLFSIFSWIIIYRSFIRLALPGSLAKRAYFKKASRRLCD